MITSATLWRRFAGATAVTAVAGVASLVYGACLEARWFKIRHEQVPVLPAGRPRLRVLHIADLHMVPSNRAKIDFTRSLAELEPDLVVNIGDNLGHRDGLKPVLDALGPLLDLPGVFVPGSNDYFAPQPANPLKYFRGPSSQHGSAARLADREVLPYRELFSEFEHRGWVNLTNAHHDLHLARHRLAVAGTDDPHLDRDRWPGFGSQARTADLTLGVTHAPYTRVLDTMAADGAQLILAGHTHGGQIALPVVGPLVTNCDLPPRQAAGLFGWPDLVPGRNAPVESATTIVNISAGIGAAPKVPVRFACRPEAVVLDLIPAVSR
ncbi:metallophosphoesterase [Auritidibacter ignavus]|uniref:metallophosphoesterase n=1 Tax=Auritidibacter TaxID=1160973 RepID=UPI00313395AB